MPFNGPKSDAIAFDFMLKLGLGKNWGFFYQNYIWVTKRPPKDIHINPIRTTIFLVFLIFFFKFIKIILGPPNRILFLPVI